MDPQATLNELETLGTAQNRKIYARHGVGPHMYGVSFANLGKLRKRIGTDPKLADALWRTGNHDARVLATMIADPAAATRSDLNSWLRGLDNYTLTDLFAKFVKETPHARAKMEQWIRSPREWTARAGWRLLAHMAMDDGELPDAVFEPYLGVIERDIHASANRVRDAMNGALIAIGLRSVSLERQAIGCARRIGKVDVDHGDTGCKTPDAIAYMRRAKQHKRRKRVR